MAPHSSTLDWKIPWMEEPGGPQSMGSLRVRQDSATLLSLFTFLHWRRKWRPTPVFLPGESQGRGSLVGCRLWGAQRRTRLKWLSSSSSRNNCELKLGNSEFGSAVSKKTAFNLYFWIILHQCLVFVTWRSVNASSNTGTLVPNSCQEKKWEKRQ